MARARAEGRGPEYLLLDEAQFIRDWGTWVKHQVDFQRQRRIAFTGSAMPLVEAGQESGVGRWHTVRLTTLSFFEYLQIKGLSLPELPELASLRALFDWAPPDFQRVAERAAPYVGHFHEYLVRGGFPQTAQVESITQAQRLLREDIIDKVLKRDMTALFGVRRVLDLEHTFLYLCLHDGGLLDMVALCSNLEVKRPTAQHFIELLEATHLIHRLPPHGYGKDVLRGRFKIYLADAAIAPAVMLKGKSILEDPTALGIATETAVFNHLVARYYAHNVRFTYWRGRRDHEVDLVAEVDGELIPFEVKYRAQHTGPRDLKGLSTLCDEKHIARGIRGHQGARRLRPDVGSAVVAPRRPGSCASRHRCSATGWAHPRCTSTACRTDRQRNQLMDRADARAMTASVLAAIARKVADPKTVAMPVFSRVLAVTPIAMARAAVSSDSACATSRAIEIVSASTSVSPSTAALV